MGAIINLAAASLLSVLCLVISSKVLATADGPDFYRVQGIASDAVLLVHAEPRLDAFVIARLPGNAACLRNLGCQGGLSLEAFSSLRKAGRSNDKTGSTIKAIRVGWRDVFWPRPAVPMSASRTGGSCR